MSSSNPKSKDENAKNKDWQIPINRESTLPEAYPASVRKTDETRKDKPKPHTTHL